MKIKKKITLNSKDLKLYFKEIDKSVMNKIRGGDSSYSNYAESTYIRYTRYENIA